MVFLSAVPRAPTHTAVVTLLNHDDTAHWSTGKRWTDAEVAQTRQNRNNLDTLSQSNAALHATRRRRRACASDTDDTHGGSAAGIKPTHLIW